MDTLGDRLRARRELLGYTLENIEEETKIRKYYISALEENRLDLLPAKVYAVGFVRKYAKVLGLDEEEIAKEFKRLAYRDEPDEEITESQSRRESINIAIKNVIAGLIFLAVALWIGKYLVDFITSDIRKQQTQPVTPPRVTQKKEKPVTQKPQTPVQPIYTGQNVVLKATEYCWVSAEVDGNRVYRGTMQPGEQKEFKGEKLVNLVLGNAGGISVVYNGKDMGTLGTRGQVVKLSFPPPYKTGTAGVQTPIE